MLGTRAQVALVLGGARRFPLQGLASTLSRPSTAALSASASRSGGRRSACSVSSRRALASASVAGELGQRRAQRVLLGLDVRLRLGPGEVPQKGILALRISLEMSL